MSGSQKQEGAALVLVLVFMSASLMLGLSALQGSLVNERLAGNYRASVISHMRAEATAAEMFADISAFSTASGGALGACPSWVELDAAASGALSGSCLKNGDEGVACLLDVSGSLCDSPSGKYIVSIGTVIDASNDLIAESTPLMVGVTLGYYFDDAIVGCDSVHLSGGAGVTGGVVSGGDVTISGGVYPPDSIAAQGVVNYPGWWDGNSTYAPLTQNFSNGVPLPSCDPHNLNAQIADLHYLPSNGNITVGNYPIVNSVLTPAGLTAFDQTWNVQADVTLATASMADAPNLPSFPDGEKVSVIRTGSFTSHNGSITVSGGNVVLFVDGDLILGAGGNEGLIIEPGSTLTVIVTGKTNFMSSLQTASLPLVTNDRPTFALYSTREDVNPGSSGANPGNSGVVVDGSTKALANIYAPGSNVSIVGSGGVKGTVRGKNIDVRGAGTIINEDASTEAGGAPDIISWR